MSKHLILTVHGIRTYGRWQERLEKLLRTDIKRAKREIEIDARHYHYGFFTLFSFVIPFLRGLAVRKFKRHFEAILEDSSFDRVDIVAHSFGTYLAINALNGLRSTTQKIHTLIFCGSVLSPDRNLSQLIGVKRSIGRLVNDCGTRDGVLLLTLLVYGVGMGGRLGLHGFQGKSLNNRYFPFGHSGYFAGQVGDEDAFMREWWVPLLLGDDDVTPRDDRPEKPSLSERTWRTLGENGATVTLSIYGILATIFAGSLLYLRDRAVAAENEALRQRDQALRTQSLFLADLAKQRVADGDGVTAINLSLEGLPDLTNAVARVPARPYVTNAQASLDRGFRTPREIAMFAAHTKSIIHTVISSDERQILTVSRDGTAALFDMKSNLRWKLEGHSGEIWSAEFSPDLSKIVTAAWDGTARIWDVRSGKSLLVLKGHRGKVWSAAFSRDGRTVVTGGEDATVRVWDAERGHLLRTLSAHSATIIAVGFSPDGRWLISVSWDGTARVWDAQTGRQVSIYRDVNGPLTGFSISPDSQLIVLTGRSREVEVLQLQSGKSIHTLAGHAGAVTVAKFSPKGNFIVTADGPPYVNDNEARIWDTKSGQLISVLRGHKKGITAASFSADEHHIITASDDDTSAVWDVVSGNREIILSAHTDRLRGASFLLDGQRAITWSDDMTARLWDLHAALARQLIGPHAEDVDMITFLQDDKLIMTSSLDDNVSGQKTTRIWSSNNATLLSSLSGETRNADDAILQGNGKLLVVTVSTDGIARVWDALKGRMLSRLSAKRVVAASTTFNDDGSRVAAASEDNTVGVFDSLSGLPVSLMIGHTGSVNSIHFMANGSRILTGSDDGTARVWNVSSGKEIYKLERREASTSQRTGDVVVGAAISPNGQRIVITYRDRIVGLWDATTMKHIASFGVPTKVSNLAYPASFSPDSQHVAAAYEQNSTGIWKASDGRLDHILAQESWVFGSRYSRTSKKLVTYSIDHTAVVWDVLRGGVLAVLSGHTNNVESADINAEETLVGTASADGTARIWKVFAQTQELIDAAKLSVPRCLSTGQRKQFFLGLDPPRWCITGAGFETESDFLKWQPKWPYLGPEWRTWLTARDRGEEAAFPGE